MKVKCEIIRDLLPSYVDELTSQESNEMVEEHLETCEACREYMEEMRTEVELPDTECNRKEIRPFRKLRQRTKRKILLAAAGGAAACILIFAGLEFYYGQSWTARKDDARVEVHKSGRIVDIKISPKKDGKTMGLEWNGDWKEPAVIEEGRDRPYQKALWNYADISFTFLDENTVMTEDGTPKEISEEDKVTLQFADDKMEISLKEMGELAMTDPQSSSEDVSIKYHRDNKGVVTLDFTSRLLGVALQAEETDPFVLVLRDGLEEDENGVAQTRGDIYSLTFLDEKTILNPDGTTTKLEGNETLKIEYKDKKVEIPLRDLATGENMEEYE